MPFFTLCVGNDVKYVLSQPSGVPVNHLAATVILDKITDSSLIYLQCQTAAVVFITSATLTLYQIR
jgi:hypothetical protein